MGMNLKYQMCILLASSEEGFLMVIQHGSRKRIKQDMN